jgi:hypothetical protein
MTGALFDASRHRVATVKCRVRRLEAAQPDIEAESRKIDVAGDVKGALAVAHS